MKAKIGFFIIVGAFALTSCSKDVPEIPACGREISFGCERLALNMDQTKDLNDTLLASLNLVCTKGASGCEVSEWELRGATVTSRTIATGKYWPASDNYDILGGYHFYAANTDLYIGTDGVYTDSLSSSLHGDIVCASISSPDYNGPNTLVFNHIFAQVGMVNLTPVIAGSTLANVKLFMRNVKDGGVYNLRDASWIETGSGHNTDTCRVDGLFLSGNSSSFNGLLVVPGTYILDVSYGTMYTLSNGSQGAAYFPSRVASVTLPAGVITHLNIQLPQTSPRYKADGGQSRADFSVSVKEEEWPI